MRTVLDEFDQRLEFSTASADGAKVAAGTALGEIVGPARSLLTAERVLLNFLGRLSGIASLTARFAEAIAGTKAKIYDTRKTTPGWRRLEKYAVRQGGGQNHRTGLFDAILIKDNHLAMAAGDHAGEPILPAEAVDLAREFLRENFPEADLRREMIVEIEVDSLEQLQEVLPKRPDIVLLDNMNTDQLRRAVSMRDEAAPEVELEASGGVSLASVRAIAETGVERISSGTLTHSAVCLDVAFGLGAIENCSKATSRSCSHPPIRLAKDRTEFDTPPRLRHD